MFKEFQETFSFDDVLLVPQYSEVLSRKNVSLKTTLLSAIKLRKLERQRKLASWLVRPLGYRTVNSREQKH